MRARRRQKGVTQLEFVLVVIVVLVVIGTGAYYYSDILRDVRRLGVELLGHNFTTAVASVRGGWYVEGQPESGPIDLYDSRWHRAQVDAAIDEPGEPVQVYVNREGWPLATEPPGGDQRPSPERCHQLWQALLEDPPRASVAGREPAGTAAYHIAVSDGQCRYQLMEAGRPGHYVAYHPDTGKVRVVTD